MPNASRYLELGYTYHLTLLCHDKRFLLCTIRKRHDYRQRLRDGARAAATGSPASPMPPNAMPT